MDPHSIHHDPTLVGSTQVRQKGLRYSRLVKQGDILDYEGNIIPWEDRPNRDIPLVCRVAYKKLTGNIRLDARKIMGADA